MPGSEPASSGVVRSTGPPAHGWSLGDGTLSLVRLVSHLSVPFAIDGGTAAPPPDRHAAVPVPPMRVAAVGTRDLASTPPWRNAPRRTPRERTSPHRESHRPGSSRSQVAPAPLAGN